jgi:hypothetical protein
VHVQVNQQGVYNDHEASKQEAATDMKETPLAGMLEMNLY